MMEAQYSGVTTRGPGGLWLQRGAFAAVLLSTMVAQAQPTVGGPGGAPFTDQPPSGARLGAVALRAGELIDAIAAVVVLPDGRRVGLPMHGGPGGSVRAFPLQDGEYLVAMRIWSGQVVEAIQFETNLRQSTVYGKPRGTPRRLEVPLGAQAVGFVGRAGVYVDALGFALQARAPQSPSPQNPSAGSNAPRPASPVAPAPAPAPAVTRVELDGQVTTGRSTTSSVTIVVRFKQPAFLKMNLSTKPPRSGKCFDPQQEQVLRSWTSPTAEKKHVKEFPGLQYDTLYHYSILLDGGKCELGTAKTAVCMHGPPPC